MAAAGFEPGSTVSSGSAESKQNSAKSKQNSALPDSADPSREQIHAFPEHSQDKAPHPKCVIYVSRGEVSEDLAEVVAAWPELPQEIRAEILAKVQM
jgi:hypothetical protein